MRDPQQWELMITDKIAIQVRGLGKRYRLGETHEVYRTFRDTLATLPAAIQQADVRSPALLIVGEVVKLRSRLAWFEPAMVSESRPLPRAGVSTD